MRIYIYFISHMDLN